MRLKRFLNFTVKHSFTFTSSMSKAIIVLQIQVCVIELEASEALLVSFVNVKFETVYREIL